MGTERSVRYPANVLRGLRSKKLKMKGSISGCPASLSYLASWIIRMEPLIGGGN